jgi:hypothetical protein
MIGGAFKFIFAIIVFFITMAMANPVLASLEADIVLPNWGLVACSLLMAGWVVKSD